MAKRRVAYRKRHQNRFSMFLVSLVVVLIMITVAVRSIDLLEKIDAKSQELEQIESEIADEEKRSEEIQKFAKEVKTKGYVERIARDQLGLVHENEILFKKNK